MADGESLAEQDDACSIDDRSVRYMSEIVRRKSILSLPRINRANSIISQDTVSHFSGLSLSPTSLDESLSDVESNIEEEDEDDEVEQKSKGEEEEKKEGKRLSNKEEKAIEIKARRHLLTEFSRLKKEGRENMTEVKKKFKAVIDNARSALIAARIEAEKESINKLETTAEQQHEVIKKKRMERKKQLQNELFDKSKGLNVANKMNQFRETGWVKLELDEMATLRKIQADLDRAKARRRSSIAVALKSNKGRVRVRNLMQTEVRRLEKAEEVHKLILELHELNLRQHAIKLTHALKDREDKEERLRSRLKDEAARVKKKCEKMKEEEIASLRKERFSELERLELERLRREQERKQREERERREKIMAALKQKARNQAMRKNMEITRLNARISRQYNFSYFQ